MSTPLLPVRIESEWLLVDAANVVEVLGSQTWIPIPHTRQELPGVLAWRGRAIPVLDIAPLFGLPRLSTRETRPRTLVVELERSMVAIPVDAAREVQMIAAGDLHPAHARSFPFADRETELFSVVMPIVDLVRLVNQATSSSQDHVPDVASA